MSLPSEASEPTPTLPPVKAIAPNAPIGAVHITMPTMMNSIFEATSMTSTSGFARSPSQTRAKPDKTAMNRTWRMFPSVKAPTHVLGQLNVGLDHARIELADIDIHAGPRL